jgi:succinyl-CoA synthetase beta subunit
MFEINPVLKRLTKILAVDAKVNIDDNALYRQKLTQMRYLEEKSGS